MKIALGEVAVPAASMITTPTPRPMDYRAGNGLVILVTSPGWGGPAGNILNFTVIAS